MAVESAALVFSIKDFSKELTTTSIGMAMITSANFDAQIVKRDAIIDAVEDLLLGLIQKIDYGILKKFTTGTPTNKLARREDKLLIHYEDTTLIKGHTWSVGAVNLALYAMQGNTDIVNMADGTLTLPGVLKTALEAGAVSPAGNAIVVREMQLVGRNL